MDEGGKTSEDEAFWRFSLAFYERPGVADALIALQDCDGFDVNLVLFALWLGVSGRGGRAGMAKVVLLASTLAEASMVVRGPPTSM